MSELGQRGLIAGFYASIVGIIFGTVVGGLGAWNAVAASANTPLGGWLVLLVIGSALGYIYSYFGFNRFFGKESLVKGAAYGVAIWIVTLIASSIFPALGESAFASPIRANLFLQLLTHLVYGSTLGVAFEKQK